MNLIEKIDKLHKIIRRSNKLAIAFSGGVDSTFLLKKAYNILKDNIIAITINSSIIPKHEFKQAVDFCEKNKIKHIIIELNKFDIEKISHNPENRCYLCKKIIFNKIKKVALDNNIKIVADGSNIDDIKDYRPGIKALNELNIISPLKDSELTKLDIRKISKDMNLLTWNKPAFACLASRIPYGMKITNEKLEMIEIAEDFFLNEGFSQIRVRHHGNIARIEVIFDEIDRFFNREFINKVNKKLKEIGFSYVTLDLAGYRTGSLNENIRK